MSTIDTIRADGHTDDLRGARRRLGAGILALLQFVAVMLEKRRSRLALMAMTDDQLKDIGLSRADAVREGLRRPWE